jgi:hypothetical protein
MLLVVGDELVSFLAQALRQNGWTLIFSKEEKSWFTSERIQ